MKFSNLLSVATAALLASCGSAQQASPGVAEGSLANSHDPAVIRRESDGKYFKFSTNNHINTQTADSMEGPWEYVGQSIPDGSFSATVPNFGDLWAPDVHKVGDYYYMYYCLASGNVQTAAIAVTRSTTLEIGSWEDLGPVGIESDGTALTNAIDPTFIEVDGSYYLTWGSFWSDIYQVKLKDNLHEIDGEPYQISFQPADDHAEEGAYVHQNGDYFYLFYSAGACCGLDVNEVAAGKEYQIKVCRSTRVDGDYVDYDGVSCLLGGGTTMLSTHDDVYAPGGQGVFTDPISGDTIVYFHYADLTLGKCDGCKKLGWNVLDFSSGWPMPLEH